MKSVLRTGEILPCRMQYAPRVKSLRRWVDGFPFTRAKQGFHLPATAGDFTVRMHDLIKGVHAMAENKLTDLSMDFAVQTLQLCETIHSHSALVNQLERSSTSIGATFVRRVMRTERQTSSPSSRSRSRNVMRRNTGWSCSSVQALPTSTASTRSDVPAARSGECPSLPSTPRRKTAHDLPARPHRGRVFLLRPSRSRCTQPLRQLPARQAAHQRVETVGAHRQSAMRTRP